MTHWLDLLPSSAFSNSLLFKHFLQLYCPNGITPMGNSGCSPQGKPAATESRYPAYSARLVFQCNHNAPNSGMDYRIFNLCTDVNACGCTGGCTDTVRESALKVVSGRGNEPVSAACQFDALPFEPHPQLLLFLAGCKQMLARAPKLCMKRMTCREGH